MKVSNRRSLFPSYPGTVSSPQFQQALSMFSAGFRSGQLAPLIREFELGAAAEAAANSGDLEAFVKAMEEKNAKGSQEEGKKKEDEPEDMALD